MQEPEPGRRAQLADQQAEAHLQWLIENEFDPGFLISVGAVDLPPETVKQRWKQISNAYNQITGRMLRDCGVLAASKIGDLPHLHSNLQKPEDVDVDLLVRLGHKWGLFIEVTNTLKEPPYRDAREYTSSHLRRIDSQTVEPEVVPGVGIRTARIPDIARRLRREYKKRRAYRRSRSGGPHTAPASRQPVAELSFGRLRPLFPPQGRSERRTPKAATKRSTCPQWKPKSERRAFSNVLLRAVRPEDNPYLDGAGRRRLGKKWTHDFEETDGKCMQWDAWNERPVVGPDGVTYPMEPGLRWNFGSSRESVGGVGAADRLRSGLVNALRASSTSFRPFG